MVKGVVEVEQVIVYRLYVVGLAGDDVKTKVVQVIHQGGSVGDIPQHGEAVTAGRHIENTKYPSSVTEVDIALPKVQVISAVSGIEGKAGWGMSQDLIKPVPVEARYLTLIIDLRARLLQHIQKGAIEDSDPDSLQYPAPRPVDPLHILRC